MLRAISFRGPRRLAAQMLLRGVSEKAWVCVKVGNNILIGETPYQVIKATQGGRGRGASFVKSTLKNRLTGKTMDKTFNSEDPVDIPDVQHIAVEFSWEDTDDFVFMDTKSFEEIRVPKESVAKRQYLVPGQQLGLYKYKEHIVDMIFPTTSEFTVESVDLTQKLGKGFAAKLTTGAVISVPQTILVGERVLVHIQNEEFFSRA